MTPSQFERLQEVLTAIEPHVKKMTGASPGFVRDQIDRMERYGVNIRVSPKQAEWLEGLYATHCGVTGFKILEEPRASRSEVLGDNGDDDLDDEIPF